MKTTDQVGREFFTRRARWKFAGELDISVTTARRHLEVLVASGRATVRSGIAFSDMGRMTNVNEYCWETERR